MIDYRERFELKHYLSGQLLESRLRVLHVGLGLLLLAFLLDFWNLQGVHGEEYRRLAENNRLRRIPIAAPRGVIFDRNHEVLATTRPSIDLVLQRDGVEEGELVAELERLEPILGVPLADLRERLIEMRRRPDFEPLVLEEDVGLERLARIEVRRERFPRVDVERSIRRHYPHGDLFSHVLGYIGEVSESQLAAPPNPGPSQLARGDIVGKSGIERNYDDTVRGRRGWKLVTVNSLGRRMGEEGSGVAPIHGKHLDLTLDVTLQRALREGLGAEAGAGVFLDPRTGEVLALVSTPAFDPNRFAAGLSRQDWKELADDPRRPLHDRAIASYYAPGSTFKMVLALAGLDTSTITAADRVHCSGSATHYGHRRLCWRKEGHGSVDVSTALARSCNVYFYQLGRELGIERIERYGRMLHLGQETGIDLPGEEPAILPSDAWKRRVHGEPWYPGDTISVAIGQGLLATTPLQMAVAAGAIGTGSVCRPHVLRGHASKPERLAVSPAALAVVRHGMREVVERGTAGRAALDGITVAGKTGTAQVFKHSAGIDADELPKHERDHAWFVGYAPAEDPLIAFAVVVEHGGHGGTTAAPIARAVLEAFFAPSVEPAPAERREQLRAAVARPAGEDDVRAPAAR